MPLDYAMANYNLGNSLQLAGQFKDDPALLKAGDRCLPDALKHYTREQIPQQWALVQAYMGSTLQSLATYESPIETLKAIDRRAAVPRWRC